MNKPVYLGPSVLEFSKTLMYKFWYDNIELKYRSNSKLCCMDPDNFIIHIKIEDAHEDIASNVEKRFDTSNYGNKRPFLIEKHKKVIGLLKDELGGKSMT